jgi:hypothetical protein
VSSLLRILPFFALALMGMAVPAAGQSPTPSQAALDELVKMYCDAWGEPDVAKRRQLLERVWAEDATYTDPVTNPVKGREALVNHISAHLKKYSGSRIVPSSHANVHHGTLRFTWQFVLPDGKVQTEGIDFGELTPDGRIGKIVGFFGSLKPLQVK